MLRAGGGGTAVDNVIVAVVTVRIGVSVRISVGRMHGTVQRSLNVLIAS